MPDEYGFETEADRIERQKAVGHALVDRQEQIAGLMQFHETKVTEIFQGFLRAHDMLPFERDERIERFPGWVETFPNGWDAGFFQVDVSIDSSGRILINVKPGPQIKHNVNQLARVLAQQLGGYAFVDGSRISEKEPDPYEFEAELPDRI